MIWMRLKELSQELPVRLQQRRRRRRVAPYRAWIQGQQTNQIVEEMQSEKYIIYMVLHRVRMSHAFILLIFPT